MRAKIYGFSFSVHWVLSHLTASSRDAIILFSYTQLLFKYTYFLSYQFQPLYLTGKFLLSVDCENITSDELA